jgi:hypothetical protein
MALARATGLTMARCAADAAGVNWASMRAAAVRPPIAGTATRSR